MMLHHCPSPGLGEIHSPTTAITFFTRSRFGFLSFDAPSRLLAAIQVGLSLPYGLYHAWMIVQMSFTAYISQVPLDTCTWEAKPCPSPAKPACTHLGSGGCNRAQQTPDATVPLAMPREIVFTMQGKFFQPFLACVKSPKAARTGFLLKVGF